MKTMLKKSDSSVRVLEFLKLLYEDDIVLKDINLQDCNKFKNIETTETFLKYISTLEILGIDIRKIDKKYSLYSYIQNESFSDEEIDLLAELYVNFDTCCIENQRQYFDQLITNIMKLMKKSPKIKLNEKIESIKNLRQDKLSQKAQEYQHYADIEQQIKIKYNGEDLLVLVKRAEIENNKIYIEVYNVKTHNIMRILTDSIESFEILPRKSIIYHVKSSIVFEVYDRLAVNYRLRENENVQTFTDNKKVIINYGEDKNKLIRRLLKYGENCKIISPNSFVEDYLKELNMMKEKICGVPA
ncbi:hypothetical protein IJG14_04450 [bacterium]|nr:hypothetical protein [bacterium]